MVQRTFRRYKLQQVIGAALMLLGMAACRLSPNAGYVSFVLGGIWFLFGSFQVWWHHG